MKNKIEEKLLDERKRKRIIYLKFFFVFFVIMVLMISVYFCLTFLQKESKEFIFQKNKVIALEKETREIEYFQKKYSFLLPLLKKIDQMFVDSQNPLDLIEFLESSAQEENIKIKFFPFSFSQDKELMIKLNLRGEFPSIINFLRKIEGSSYLISIQELSFLAKTQESLKEEKLKSSSELEANLLLKVLSNEKD